MLILMAESENTNALYPLKPAGLFGCFRPTRKYFTNGEITIANERLQMLTYARHIFCDTGHLFIIVISEDPSPSHVQNVTLRSHLATF